MLAKAGIHDILNYWIPASAGMTENPDPLPDFTKKYTIDYCDFKA
jgi:hypothetical protein